MLEAEEFGKEFGKEFCKLQMIEKQVLAMKGQASLVFQTESVGELELYLLLTVGTRLMMAKNLSRTSVGKMGCWETNYPVGCSVC